MKNHCHEKGWNTDECGNMMNLKNTIGQILYDFSHMKCEDSETENRLVVVVFKYWTS